MTRPEFPEFGPVLDLPTIENELRGEEAYAREGHTGRTLLRQQELRVVLIAIKAGERIPEHLANVTMSIHTLAGLVHVRLPGLARQDADLIVELRICQFLALDRHLRRDGLALKPR